MVPSARMSPVDAAWLRMDRPSNPMVIVSVTVLAGRCTTAALRRLLERRLLRFPRFSCLPVADALGGSWVPDEHFDLRAHVGERKLPPDTDEAALQQAVGALAGTPLDPTRPRWRFDLLQVPGRGSALVMRMHHCYADGIALVKTFIGMTSPTPAGEPHDVASRTDPDVGAGPELHVAVARLAGELVAAGRQLVSRPGEALASAGRVVGEVAGVATSLAGLLALPDDPPTPLRGTLGLERRVAWAPPLPFADVRAVAHSLDCTINDVLLSLVAGSLGRYLQSRQCDLTGLQLRAALPVNLRPADEPLRLGNRFGLVLVDLPVGLTDARSRLHAVRTSMRGLKDSSQAVATFTVLNALGAAPAAVETVAIDVLSRKASAVISNVPGPREPLYLCGHRIEQMYFWVPQSGSIGVGISVLSYAGQAMVGVVADAGLVPAPAAALEGLDDEFAQLRRLASPGRRHRARHR